MRKVANRLSVLEERYKDLPHQERAKRINEQMLHEFCVGEREVKRWKSIVRVATKGDNIVTLQPSHYLEIAKLPEEKQKEVIEEVTEKNLTYQETALLVQQTLGKSEFKPQIYNVWNFNGCDDKYGTEKYPGRTPGQIVENVLYYFTEENDLIVDPMAGSGTTLDVCKAMNRKCLGYDLKPYRDNIVMRDITKGFSEDAKNCKLIYLDPPYYNMVFKDLFKTVEHFYSFIHELAEDSYETVAENGYVSLLMQDMTELGNYCLSGDCYSIFISHGFKCVAHISCPLSTEQWTGRDVNWAKENKILLGRNRDLYIFKKEAKNG